MPPWLVLPPLLLLLRLRTLRPDCERPKMIAISWAELRPDASEAWEYASTLRGAIG